jgi:DNA primase
MDTWVDFKAVKAAVSMEEILKHYGISLRKVNDASLRGRCPLPAHGSKDSGNSFTVSITKNVWSCMSSSCVAARGGAKGGNVLDFTAAMERSTIREAAGKLAAWFMEPGAPTVPEQEPRASGPEAPRQEPNGGRSERPAEENKVLTFTLKGVTYCDYLKSRGISEETAAAFSVGLFPGRGTMSGRIVVPIHNERGELVAYAGRSTDNTEPKYKFPAGFHKSQVLFNLHRVTGNAAVVVEGFFDCMKVWQAANQTVVALMGSTLSDEQERLICDRFRRVTLFLDGDDAGRAAATGIAGRLMRRVYVRVVDLPDGKQPDMLTPEEIAIYVSL